MKKALGYLLFGLGLLILWPIQIGLWLYGLFYIIRAFIDGGAIAGLISIPIVGISLAVIYIIIHVLTTPYMALVSPLLGTEKRERELSKRRIKEQEAEMLGAEDLKSHSETRKVLSKLGMTPQQIEDEVAKQDQEIDKNLVERFRSQNKPELARKEIAELRTLIAYHKSRYYALDNSEISDAAYDYLKNRLHLLEEAYPQFAVRKSK